MKTSTIAFCFVLMTALFPARAGEIAWAPLDFAAAAQKAAAEGKLIHIIVEGDNCPPCDAYKKTHLPDPAYVDYVSTLFVNIRAHEGDPAGQAFLESLNLTHPAVPRFYILSPEGKGISMTIGMVAAPPMEGAEVLAMATGVELPVNKEAAAAVAGRLRAHAANIRATGKVFPDNPLRPIGIAALEAQAWVLAGRADEAERAFGGEWATQLVDQDIMDWYINFWLAWDRNLPGALEAAKILHQINTAEPNSIWLLAVASAANGDYAEAVRLAEHLAQINPADESLNEIVGTWRQQLQ